MKQKIIFLDIDGVLNGYGFGEYVGWKIVCLFKSKRIRNWYRRVSNPCGVHESKMKILAKIVKKTNAKVVLSSSWRYGWWSTPYEKQSENQKQLTELLNKYNIEVIDITGRSPDGRRDKEIRSWINDNLDKIYSFVIIDDERFDLECFVGSRLIQTSSTRKGQMIKGHWFENTGLKWKHVKKAIFILGVEY